MSGRNDLALNKIEIILTNSLVSQQAGIGNANKVDRRGSFGYSGIRQNKRHV